MPKNTLILICSVFLLLSIIETVPSCSKSGDNTRVVSPPVIPPPVTPPVITKKWIVSAVAGSGVQGKDDGDSIYASFHFPSFITIDDGGNLFVSDLLNFNIRKITPAAHVSTYAGKDVSSPDPLFGNIYGLAMDKQGNLYDIEYSLIRKISSPTVSSVFAGNLTEYYKDSMGIDAGFHVISRLTIDKDNNLFLPDYDMNGYPHIRKITPDGTVSTLTLQDNTVYQDINGPDHYYLFSIAVDRNGNLYKTSNGSNLIKKITPNGDAAVFAGAGDIGLVDGQGTSAKFNTISDMVTDSAGNLYIADYGNNAIRKITPAGTVTTIAGTGEQGFTDGEGSKAKFYYPSGITISKDGVIYVADAGNNRIRKIEYK